MPTPTAANATPVSAAALRAWGRGAFLAVGMGEGDAALLAASLVMTSLWGVDTHGVVQFPHYLERLARGSIKARPVMRVERTGPGTAQLHADQAHGILAAHRATGLACELARESGLGAVGVSDSSHCGALALYTRDAAREGFVAFAFTHANTVAATHGGRRAFFGTNPVSIAFPRAGHEPACLDMATTSVPWNRVLNARREGHALPPDVAVDAAGHVTTDALAAAAVTPLGGAAFGHKGYALALMVDLLCGPLNGAPFGPHIPPMHGDLDVPRRLGSFFLVLDPMRFAGGPALAATVQRMAEELAAEPGSPRMPGDPELDTARRREVEGIPVEPGLAALLAAWSERLSIPAPEPGR
jgi:ureidoglycolate dehydrogenase (NAD+)